MLEIGGGVGILSEYLAERVAHLHVIEVDRHLEGALRDATDRFANVELHWGDAVRIDLRALAPEPNKVVANLPYGVATSALVRTIDELPSVSRWVVMVQREVGERLAAQAGERAYGASSVIVQLACEVKVLRAIPRTVFFPVPNVDSVLLGMRRRAAAGAQAQAAGEDGAAGARARVLRTPAKDARGLARARRRGGGGRGGPRALAGARARGARAHGPSGGRARRAPLAPGLRRARGAARVMSALPLQALAPAKINLGLRIGPLARDGRHELVSVMQSISLADELRLEWAQAESDEVLCPGVEGPPERNLAAIALASFRAETGWDAPPRAPHDRQARAGGGGARRRLRRRGGRAAPARGRGGR